MSVCSISSKFITISSSLSSIFLTIFSTFITAYNKVSNLSLIFGFYSASSVIILLTFVNWRITQLFKFTILTQLILFINHNNSIFFLYFYFHPYHFNKQQFYSPSSSKPSLIFQKTFLILTQKQPCIFTKKPTLFSVFTLFPFLSQKESFRIYQQKPINLKTCVFLKDITNQNMSITAQLNTQYQNYSPSSYSDHSSSTDDEITQDHITHHRPNINICKYKTEICKNYSEMGYCPYWEKCQFAHGNEDLCWRQPINPKKYYRTRQCRPFWEKANCNYGFRCQFSHYECSRSEQQGKQFLNLAKHFYSCENSQNGSKLLRILKNN